MDFEPVKLGFAGAGSYGRYLGKMAHASRMIDVRAVFDPDPEAAEQFRAETGGLVMSTFEEMLTDLDIEGIVFCTPNQYHRRDCLLAASAGKHIFVDQPIANMVNEAREMLTATQTSGVLLMVGHNSRRNIAIRQLRAVLEQGNLGRILMAEGNFSSMMGYELTAESWRFHERTCPGGPMMDLGIHIVDIFNYLFGAPAAVAAMHARLTGHTEVHDTANMLVRYESGVQVYVGSSFVSPTTHYLRLYGTACNMIVSASSAQVELHYPDGSVETPEVETPFDEFRNLPTQFQELEEFAYCIRTGQNPETDGWAGLYALAVIEGAVVSARENRVVELAEYLKPLEGTWSPGETA